MLKYNSKISEKIVQEIIEEITVYFIKITNNN